MVFNTYNKKGAVEMSLNLIIMLVVGLTVLGLIIAFVTGFLGQAEDQVFQALDADADAKLEEIKSQPGMFVVSPSRLTVDRGASAALYMKFENPHSEDVVVLGSGGALADTAPSGDDAPVTNLLYTLSGAGTSGITITSPPVSLQSLETVSFPLNVEVGSGTATGTYFASLEAELTIGTGDDAVTEKQTKTVTIVVE